ncbi:MAG: hypothetical protein ACI8S6_006004 [Myxococcota bacterium]|jgi:hypothetical protein
MRLSFLLLALLTTACTDDPWDSGGGDTISFSNLESGSYTLAAPDGGLLTLVLDTEASTYTLALDSDEPSEGTLTVLATEDWTTCCYLNGSGHDKFETVALSEPVTLGGLDLQEPYISADGPVLFDGLPFDTAESHDLDGPL